MSMKILPWLKKHRHDPDQGETPVRYSDLDGTPEQFPPKAHGHKWDEITETPATYPPESHTHNEVAGLKPHVVYSTVQNAAGTGFYVTNLSGKIICSYSVIVLDTYGFWRTAPNNINTTWGTTVVSAQNNRIDVNWSAIQTIYQISNTSTVRVLVWYTE